MSQAPHTGWNKATVVTTSDTVNLTFPAQALYVGGTGTVTAVLLDDTTVLFSAIPVGAILPVRCKRVNATGTSATLIVALWDI